MQCRSEASCEGCDSHDHTETQNGIPNHLNQQLFAHRGSIWNWDDSGRSQCNYSSRRQDSDMQNWTAMVIRQSLLQRQGTYDKEIGRKNDIDCINHCVVEFCISNSVSKTNCAQGDDADRVYRQKQFSTKDLMVITVELQHSKQRTKMDEPAPRIFPRLLDNRL